MINLGMEVSMNEHTIVTKLCHVKPGMIFFLMRADMTTDDSAQYMLIVSHNFPDWAKRHVLTGNLYTDINYVHLRKVNIVTGEMSELPHLSSKVRVFKEGTRVAIFAQAQKLLDERNKFQADLADITKRIDGAQARITQLDLENKKLKDENNALHFASQEQPRTQTIHFDQLPETGTIGVYRDRIELKVG